MMAQSIGLREVAYRRSFEAQRLPGGSVKLAEVPVDPIAHELGGRVYRFWRVAEVWQAGKPEREPYDPRRVFWMTAEERNAYTVSPSAAELERPTGNKEALTADKREDTPSYACPKCGSTDPDWDVLGTTPLGGTLYCTDAWHMEAWRFDVGAEQGSAAIGLVVVALIAAGVLFPVWSMLSRLPEVLP